MWPEPRKREQISRAVCSMSNVFIRYGAVHRTVRFTLRERAIEVNRPYLPGGWRGPFSRPQGVNDETKDRDANTGIGDVKRRPRMSKRHMQIEEQKIDNVSVTKTIGQISKN